MGYTRAHAQLPMLHQFPVKKPQTQEYCEKREKMDGGNRSRNLVHTRNGERKSRS
jgi:hypothetical protein